MLFSDPFFPLVTQLQRPAAFVPLADVTVSDADMVLTMDLPGVRAEDLDIQFLDRELVVRGVRHRPQLPDGSTWAHVERSFGEFERRIRLPDGIDADHIMASVENGVLSLIVPKPERLKPRTIAIGTDTGTDQHELATATT